jgi:uncharacterized protein (TIGR02996 family)
VEVSISLGVLLSGFARHAMGKATFWGAWEERPSGILLMQRRTEYAMTEQEFYAEICRDPDDDVARLIFSDWLEENGQPDRAEFIRLQVARANDETGDLSRPELLEREQELLERHREEWLKDLPQLPGVVWGNWFSRPSVKWHHFRCGFLFHAEINDVDSIRHHTHAICRHTTVRGLSFQLASGGNRVHDWMQELRKLVECPEISSFAHLRILPTASIRAGAQGVRLLTESRHLGRLRALHLSHQSLGDEGAALLAASLRSAELTELGLGDNGLTSQALMSLAQSPHLAKLRHLDLSFASPLDDAVPNKFDAAGMTALGTSNRLQQLQSLRLNSTALVDAAATALAQAVLPRLRTLDLSDNKISAIGVRQLARYHLLSGLRELRIGGNPVGTAGAVALTKTAPLDHLHTLDLSGTGLGTEAVFVLGGSALGQRLGHLNLSGNPIGVEGMRFFLERRFWPNLQRLCLSYLPHERDVAESLKECWGPRADLSLASEPR